MKGIRSDIIATYRIIIQNILTSIYLPTVTQITCEKFDHARSHLCVII